MRSIKVTIVSLMLFLMIIAISWRTQAAEQPEIKVQIGRSDKLMSIAISPDGRYALSGSQNNTVKLWEVAGGKEVRAFVGHSDAVAAVTISRDGRYALSGSNDKTLKLWDIADGKELRTFTGHSDWITSVAFSPDGKYALSGSIDKTLRLWDVATGKELRTFTGHSAWVWSVAFSPDGKYALSGSMDKTLKLWDTATGKELRTFSGHSGLVSSVIFSPDGKYALSGSIDKTLKLWEVSSGKEIRTFTGHFGGIISAAISPNGRYALSGSDSGEVKLWEIADGKELPTFIRDVDLRKVFFSPNGQYALLLNNYAVKLWPIQITPVKEFVLRNKTAVRICAADGGVMPERTAIAARAVQQIDDYMVRYAPVLSDRPIYIYLTSTKQSYAEVIFKQCFYEDMESAAREADISDGITLYAREGIAIIGPNPEVVDWGYALLIAHEMIHLYQQVNMGASIALAYAKWIEEGTADYWSAKAVDKAFPGSYQAYKEGWTAYLKKGQALRLTELFGDEKWNNEESQAACYAVSFLTFDYLERMAGADAIVNFVKLCEKWDGEAATTAETVRFFTDRFETAFQMNFEKFEREYYDYLRQQGIEVAMPANKPI